MWPTYRQVKAWLQSPWVRFLWGPPLFLLLLCLTILLWVAQIGESRKE